MHVAPAKAATIAFEQKLIEAPLCENVQHSVFPLSVQSAGVAHKRKISLPEQVVPVVVGHAALVAHATTGGSVVQLGTEPPVTVMCAQQTGVELEQPAGDMHTKPPLSPEEAESDEDAESPPDVAVSLPVSLPPPPVSVAPPLSWPPPAESPPPVDASSPPPPAVESSPPHADSAAETTKIGRATRARI
jgi:hypothetical protein